MKTTIKMGLLVVLFFLTMTIVAKMMTYASTTVNVLGFVVLLAGFWLMYYFGNQIFKHNKTNEE